MARLAIAMRHSQSVLSDTVAAGIRMSFDRCSVEVCVTLGLGPDDVAILKQRTARDAPSVIAYLNTLMLDAVPAIEGDTHTCADGTTTVYFTTCRILTADLPALLAARLRWDQANAGFPTYSAADFKDNKWITYTLRGEAVVEDALTLYPELAARWGALAGPARGLLLWHALTLAIRPENVDVDGLLRDHAPCDHAIVWLLCAYLHCEAFPPRGDECASLLHGPRRPESPMRLLTRSAGSVLTALTRGGGGDVLRSGPVPFDVELDLCAAVVHRIARRGIVGVDRAMASDRLYRLADAMYLARDLSQEQAFDVFRRVYDRHVQVDYSIPFHVTSNATSAPRDRVPPCLCGIGFALADEGETWHGARDMHERLSAAQRACEVRFVALEGPDEERHEQRFCVGHGTDRLLCGTVVVTRERACPTVDEEDIDYIDYIDGIDGIEGDDDDMAWRVRAHLSPARGATTGHPVHPDVFQAVIRINGGKPAIDVRRRSAAEERDPWACTAVAYTKTCGPVTVHVSFMQ